MTPLYRDFETTHALDLEYQPSLNVKNAADFEMAYSSLSQDYISKADADLDVRYGPTRDEYLDIYTPKRLDKGPYTPVYMFLHGGYWRSFGARDFAFAAKGVVERGAIAVVPNYGLLPRLGIPEIVAQARGAVAWVARNIASYGGDPTRLIVSGHSAGGHLAAMAAITDWNYYDLAFGPIAGIVPISGVFDLSPLPHTFLAPFLHLTASDMRRYSPQMTTLPAKLPPTSLAFGALESNEFQRQSNDFGARLRASGHNANSIAVHDRDHFSVILDLQDPHSVLVNEVMALANRSLIEP